MRNVPTGFLVHGNVLQMMADHEMDPSSSQILDAESGWRRSSFCASGTCVEVATDGPRIGIRDGKAPAAGELWLTPAEFRAFIAAVRDENFG